MLLKVEVWLLNSVHCMFGFARVAGLKCSVSAQGCIEGPAQQISLLACRKVLHAVYLWGIAGCEGLREEEI